MIQLTQSFRQQGDQRFLKCLDEIRAGYCSLPTIQLLQSRFCVDAVATDSLFLQSRLIDVETYNLEQISALKKRGVRGATFLAFMRGDVETYLPPDKRRVKDRLELALTARVMLVVNLDLGKGLANGSMGSVVDFDESDFPIVKFDTILNPITIFPFTWEVRQEENGETLAVFRQIPLQLSWSITIHKAQGMTLEKARISLSNVFAYGQAYTALSRVTTSDGLFLTAPFDPSVVKADPAALRFYGLDAKESATVPSSQYLCLSRVSSNIFAGRTFIITGEFKCMKREELGNLIFRFGGHLVKTLTKHLTDAVVGKKAGPKKLKHFEENKIHQWSEDEIIEAIRKSDTNKL